jgi:hypothetical protein
MTSYLPVVVEIRRYLREAEIIAGEGFDPACCQKLS